MNDHVYWAEEFDHEITALRWEKMIKLARQTAKEWKEKYECGRKEFTKIV